MVEKSIIQKYEGKEFRLLGFYNNPGQTMYPEDEYVDEAAYLAQCFKKTLSNVSEIKEGTNQVQYMLDSAVFVFKTKDSDLYAYFPQKNIARISNVCYDKKHIVKAEWFFKKWFRLGEPLFTQTTESTNTNYQDWDKYESLYKIGTVHSGQVIKLNEEGALVSLEGGGQANCSIKHLIHPDGKIATIGNRLMFSIYRFYKYKTIRVKISVEKIGSNDISLLTESEMEMKRLNAKTNAKSIFRQLVMYNPGDRNNPIPVNSYVKNIESGIISCILDGNVISGKIENILGWEKLEVNSPLFACSSKGHRIIYGVAPMSYMELVERFEYELDQIPSEKNCLWYDRMISLVKYLKTTFMESHQIHDKAFKATIKIFRQHLKTFMRYTWNVSNREFSKNGDYDEIMIQT